MAANEQQTAHSAADHLLALLHQPCDYVRTMTVGEKLPDFEFPDAQGRPINLHQDLASRKNALVLYRSAVW